MSEHLFLAIIDRGIECSEPRVLSAHRAYSTAKLRVLGEAPSNPGGEWSYVDDGEEGHWRCSLETIRVQKIEVLP